MTFTLPPLNLTSQPISSATSGGKVSFSTGPFALGKGTAMQTGEPGGRIAATGAAVAAGGPNLAILAGLAVLAFFIGRRL